VREREPGYIYRERNRERERESLEREGGRERGKVL
jgi:hypothetical protein